MAVAVPCSDVAVLVGVDATGVSVGVRSGGLVGGIVSVGVALASGVAVGVAVGPGNTVRPRAACRLSPARMVPLSSRARRS